MQAIPPDLLFEFDNDSSGQENTIARLVDEGKAVIKFVSSQMLSMEHGDNFTSLLEVMRADISGSGEQEILVHSYGGVMGATMWGADLILLGRSSRDAKLERRDLKLQMKI